METIGFIGLGIMGRPMALNLLKAGYPLVVHNRSQGAVKELVNAGATAADNPAAVAKQVDILITMLPDTPDVDQVLLGSGQAIKNLRPGTLVIDMSTVSPAIARRVASAAREVGADALDAPVSGGDVGAQEGTLSIMVGGSKEAFERALPIFKVLGKNITLVGEAGAGQVAKAANQVIVGVTIQAVAEALTLAKRNGVDPAMVHQALMGGFAQSKILEIHGQRMLDNNHKPGFKSRLHRKDLSIALEAAREVGLPLPCTGMVRELFSALVGQEQGDADHSALVKILENLSSPNN
ncbi:MAG: 2-hydroxy-3-oxopropionate reductase [Clostridia bacterium]|nr:2-hydroxy-3-oxopropionate reductase [Clostridia bacterium]